MSTLKVYCEEGGRYLVEVLSDTTAKNDDGAEMRTVLLRCVHTLRPSGVVGPIPPGAEWDATCVLGYERLLWDLLEPTESEVPSA